MNNPFAQRINMDAEVVCVDCNGGWMSRLEKLVTPTIISAVEKPQTPRDWTLAEATAIASWLMTKAVVLDHHMLALGQDRPFFSPQHEPP